MSRSSGYAIFCDDIRREVGNRYSLIGCLGPKLNVSGEFPKILPKLGVSIRIFTHRRDRPFDVQVEILGPDQDILFESKAELPLPPESANIDDIEADENKRFAILVNAVISPARLKQPGVIRARAKVDGEEVDLGFLKVAQRSTSSSNSAPEPPRGSSAKD